jgi:uncharacterized protein YcbK (DUF882 family)
VGDLSPHFDTREFLSRDGAALPGFHRAKLLTLVRRHLEPLRAAYGAVEVVSGHRSQSHNERVGGAPRSYHLAIRGRPGAAADVKCANGSPGEWYRFLDAQGVGGLGIYPTFVHVDTRQTRARW